MSGQGSRFQRAGYKDPKPLIKVHGKPIIEYVVNLFPGEEDFLFICRQEHLDNTDMRRILIDLKPAAQIVSVEGSKKGPVWAVAQAFDHIRDEEPVIVNYCDFYMNWDYHHFKRTVQANQCDGAIPSYIGFHPHLLHEQNFYASTRVTTDGFMEEIKEKHSFTQNKMDSPQSAGTYYFRKGEFVKRYFQKMIDEDIALNGEYYASLVYNLLQRDGLKTFVYDRVPHFCQWGTPEDLEEYLYWSQIFERINKALPA